MRSQSGNESIASRVCDGDPTRNRRDHSSVDNLAGTFRQQKGDPMFSKLSLTISAALFFAVAGGAARAAPTPTNAEISAGESGNPDSIAYSTRMISRHSPSNEEI